MGKTDEMLKRLERDRERAVGRIAVEKIDPLADNTQALVV